MENSANGIHHKIDSALQEQLDEDVQQYLTFMMDNEEYGVDILSVQEIRGWEPTTVIPNSPGFVRGAINLRGTIVPIIDLRKRFGLEEMKYSAVTVVIVVKVALETGNKIMGIVVDAVSDVYSITSDMAKHAPDVGEPENKEFVDGLVTVNDKMIVLLNLRKILDI